LDGKFAYASNRRSNDLSIIDVERLTEVKRLGLGQYPQRMVVVDVPE
jgi:YVTN family beta-propeller protein